MATQVEWRRGTHAQVQVFTGAVGEVVVDLTQNRLVLQDGTTPGGWPHALLLDLIQENQIWKTVGGSANAITLTSLVPLTNAQIVAGTRAAFKATSTITSSTPTIALDGQSIPATVQRAGQNLTLFDIQAGELIVVEYDGINWQIISGAPSGNANGPINEAKANPIASASSVELGNIAGNRVDITGTTTINAFTWNNCIVGAARWVKFTGALQLTYNATSMILPTAANLLTAAGDYACFRNLGGGNTECLAYQRASGAPLISLTNANLQSFSSSGTWTAPPSFSIALVICIGSGGGGQAGGVTGVGNGGAGGGGGARVAAFLRSADVGGSQTVTVGTGGTGGSTATTGIGGVGNPGSATTFGSLVTAYGGAGGSQSGGGGGGLGGAGGTPTAGALGGGAGGNSGGAAGAPPTMPDAGGGGGSQASASAGFAGAASAYGGGGGGGGGSNNSSFAGAAGGASLFGSGGTAGPAGAASPGGNGGALISSLYGGGGGGGGGSNGGTTGANGGNGGIGGGGGGGGAGSSTFGHGGNGGNGFCIVLAW